MRYDTKKPRVRSAYWDSNTGEEYNLNGTHIIEDDDGVSTGVLDARGNPIYKYTKIKPGFIK